MPEQSKEYPQEDPRNEGGNAEPNEDEEQQSVCSSEAQDRKDLEECAGVDLRAVPTEHSGYAVLLFYIVFSFISFVFMLTASCPIEWLNDRHGNKWTIWKNVDGTRWGKYACDHKRAMFQGMEAFSIISCVISLACFFAGVFQILGMGHLGVTLLLTIIDVITLLVDWSLVVNQYHKYSCPGEVAWVAHVNRLNAGFCLTFCSFGLMLFGLIALAYWINLSFSLSECHKEKYNGPALRSTLISGAVLTIATVATAQTMFESYYSGYTLKVTFWHIEFYQRTTGLSEYWGLGSYHCKQFKSYMQAGAAFSIIGDVFLFFTLLASIGAVYHKFCKWITVGFGAASWVFLLISWAVTVGARYKTFCKNGTQYIPVAAPVDLDEQYISFHGFVITEGLGMIISAWCITTANMIYLAFKV